MTNFHNVYLSISIEGSFYVFIKKNLYPEKRERERENGMYILISPLVRIEIRLIAKRYILK